jgi:cathepsin H
MNSFRRPNHQAAVMMIPISWMTASLLIGCFVLQGGLLLLLVEATAAASSSSTSVTTTTTAEDLLLFARWTEQYQKQYASPSEQLLRATIFADNTALIVAHNVAYEQGYTSYRMTSTGPYTDMTGDEFSQFYLMAPQNCSATTHHSSGRLRRSTTGDDGDGGAGNALYDDDDDGIPADDDEASNHHSKTKQRQDWRTHGIITPIKNQQHCGSCWTFSTTGCLEAHYCLQHDLDCTSWSGLSEQQLVDCAQEYNNFGCDGGLPSQAFEYIKYSGGLDLERTYPYKGDQSDGLCKTTIGQVGAVVAEVFNITSYDEADLEYAVQYIGPVSIAYQVSSDFRFYDHGVYDSYNVTTNSTMCGHTPMDVNHAVVAVGLDETEGGIPFYIVRNSWGTNWGMEGYFWIKRGENLCGLSDCASFPIVPTTPSSNDDDTGNDDDNDDDTDDEARHFLLDDGDKRDHEASLLAE